MLCVTIDFHQPSVLSEALAGRLALPASGFPGSASKAQVDRRPMWGRSCNGQQFLACEQHLPFIIYIRRAESFIVFLTFNYMNR